MSCPRQTGAVLEAGLAAGGPARRGFEQSQPPPGWAHSGGAEPEGWGWGLTPTSRLCPEPQWNPALGPWGPARKQGQRQRPRGLGARPEGLGVGGPEGPGGRAPSGRCGGGLGPQASSRRRERSPPRSLPGTRNVHCACSLATSPRRRRRPARQRPPAFRVPRQGARLRGPGPAPPSASLPAGASRSLGDGATGTGGHVPAEPRAAATPGRSLCSDLGSASGSCPR